MEMTYILYYILFKKSIFLYRKSKKENQYLAIVKDKALLVCEFLKVDSKDFADKKEVKDGDTSAVPY